MEVPSYRGLPPPADCGGGAAGGQATAIAARIQSLAAQRSHEQQVLAAARNQLATAHADLLQKEQRHKHVRQNYLESMIQAHSTELDCAKILQCIEERVLATQKLEQETEKINVDILRSEEEWKVLVESSLAHHELRQELYTKQLEQSVNAQAEVERRQTAKRETVMRLIVELKQQQEYLLHKQKAAQADIAHMNDTEGQANTKVEHLAMQVRTALARVRLFVLPVHSFRHYELF